MRPRDTLAHYRIEQRLGAGGMGEVYRAHDEKLNRTVALKLLARESVSDPGRRRRFVQEAQAASSLDHPNIVTIHDIVQADGQHFIVMQFVKGHTLRALIQDGLALSTALDYAVQMADGLAAAHAAGIVHRDLKPENVIVDDKGRAKILDFGLAKLTEPAEPDEAPTRDKAHALTAQGYILGTAAYMSPEQAQGKNVDTRSDIFSFGSVLFEMVAGRRAFSGDNTVSVLAAIVRDEPEKLSLVLSSAPLELEKLIARALRKEPDRRFQSMADLRVALQEIKEGLESGSPITATAALPARERHRPRWAWTLGPVALFLILGASLSWYLSRPEPLGPPPISIPLTSYPGNEYYPALSPDGNMVAFTWTDDIHVQLVRGGEPLQLTDDPAGDSFPRWSPDGQQIAFLRRSEGGSDVYTIPALGGAERKLTTAARFPGFGLGLGWSPDGKVLALVDKRLPEEPLAIFAFSLETGQKRALTKPPAGVVGDRNPVFSPDGKTLSFVRMGSNPFNMDIYLLPLPDGAPRRLTFDQSTISGVDWTRDSRNVVYSSNREGRRILYKLSATGGEPEPVEATGEDVYWPSVSRRGRLLVYEQRLDDYNVWRAPGPRNADGAAERLTYSTRDDRDPQLSPDGTKIAFRSDRTGSQEIWLSNADGSSPAQLTFSGGAYAPQWSPDGQDIVFMSPVEGQCDLCVVSVAGGIPRSLPRASDSARRLFPSWSRDGEWIYFGSDRGGTLEIWKMTSEGGEARQVTKKGGLRALESPDGKLLYYSRMPPEGGIWKVPTGGGEETPVLAGVSPTRWALFEDGICWINGQAIEFYGLATRETTHLASIENPLPPAGSGDFVSPSPDGRWILYVQNDSSGDDLMMLENFH